MRWISVLRSTTVTFQHTYGFDGGCRDGGTLEYATGPGYSVFNGIPDAWFTAGGFNGNVSVCCGNRIAGRRAWCYSLPSWTQVSLSLGSLDGQSVKLRWRESDDLSGAGTGWYVDSVTIGSSGTAAVCATAECAVPSEVNGVRVDRAGSEALIRWNLAVNGTTSDLLRGSLGALPVGPGGGDEACLGNGLTDTSATDAEIPSAGSGFWYLVRGSNVCGSGPYGFEGLDGTNAAPRASATCP